MSKKTADRILSEICPEQEFIPLDDYFIMKLKCDDATDMYYCTALDKNSGCLLDEDKPFDCKIWPFRVMLLENVRVITISPVCPVVIKKPLSALMDFAEKISAVIFAEAEKNPSMIKPYINGYPILAVEKSDINLKI